MMIYGDDVTHVLTEEGIANLLLCRTDEEREQAIRGVAGYTPVGLGARPRGGREPARPRRHPPPEDLGIDKRAGHARPARRAVGEGPGPRLGRAVRPAPALPQLVRRSSMERLRSSNTRTPGRVPPRRRRRWWASSAPATSRCWSSRPTGGAAAASRSSPPRRLRPDLGGGAARLLGPPSARRRAHLDQRRGRHARGRQPAPRPGGRGVLAARDRSHDAQRTTSSAPANASLGLLDAAASTRACRPPSASPARTSPARRPVGVRRRRRRRPGHARRPSRSSSPPRRAASWAAPSARCTAPSWSGCCSAPCASGPRACLLLLDSGGVRCTRPTPG